MSAPDQANLFYTRIMSAKKKAVVIGGGPAGLIAAEEMLKAGLSVRLYDAMPSIGRKFLRAGKGGLNITHAEEFSLFLSRYGDTSFAAAAVLGSLRA